MACYYNEHDHQKAAWLRELMRRDLIVTGEVDERSIEDIDPGELKEFTQCHFFAGIGVWSYALRNAGWSDDTPVWTGSCPCPSFSQSGKGGGFDDPRHLWPAWFRLLEVCRPHVVFGEQVASPASLAWLDLVSADLEGAGYAIGAADLCAAGVGAPHIRQRLYFVAESEGEQQYRSRTAGRGREKSPDSGAPCILAHPERERLEGRWEQHQQSGRPAQVRLAPDFWADTEWLPCQDGKSRPAQPGTFPLAHGAPARVVRLRGYGDAIVAPLAQAFIEAYMSIEYAYSEESLKTQSGVEA